MNDQTHHTALIPICSHSQQEPQNESKFIKETGQVVNVFHTCWMEKAQWPAQTSKWAHG